MNRTEWEALDEARRWLQGGAKSRWEIANEPKMPGYIRNAINMEDTIPGYHTPDEVLLQGIRTDPAYGGGPGQGNPRQAQAAQEQAIMSTPQANSLMQSVANLLGISDSGSDASWGVQATQRDAAPTFSGNPSNNPGSAYPVVRGNLMGGATRTYAQQPQSFLSDTNPELADFIQKAVLGAMMTTMPTPVKAMAKTAMKGSAKEKQAQQIAQAAKDWVAGQGFASDYGVSGSEADNPTQQGGQPQGGTGFGDYLGGNMIDLAGIYGALPNLGMPDYDMITITQPGAAFTEQDLYE